MDDARRHEKNKTQDLYDQAVAEGLMDADCFGDYISTTGHIDFLQVT
jgi:hypothetical protein